MKLRNILAALALTSGPALAQDDMVLLLDWFVNPDHGPIIVAQEKGYFAEQDLSVEVIAPADPSDPPKLVAAGKADLAISYQPQLHLQIHEGLPLQRVGTLVATPLNCLLALTYGPIASPADLAGKKVAVGVQDSGTFLTASLVLSIDAGTGFLSRTGTISYSLEGKPIPAEKP